MWLALTAMRYQKDNFDDCCECWLLNVASIIIFTIFFPFVLHHSSFCRHHRPTQDVALKRNQTCPICLCEIEQRNKSPVYDIALVTPCCRRTWFHNKCLQYRKILFFQFFFQFIIFTTYCQTPHFCQFVVVFFFAYHWLTRPPNNNSDFQMILAELLIRKKSICIWITVACYTI